MSAQKSGNPKKVAKDNADTLSSAIDKLRNTDNTIKKEFWNAVVDNLQETLQGLSNSDELSLEDKVRHLKNIRRLVTSELASVIPQVPDKAPALWKERGKENYHMSPCDFVVQHYPSLGFGLSQADIGHLDPKLMAALRNWRDKHGWPEGFDLPSQNELNDRRLNELSESELVEISKLGAVVRHRLKRA